MSNIILVNAEAGMIPLAAGTVHCVATSPPYWGLRDYGLGNGGIGLEPTIELYVSHLVGVFREVRRVLHPSGTVWLNLGDSYANPGNKRSGEGETRNLRTDKFHGGTAHLEQRRVVGGNDRKYRLRSDLTPEQEAYVLSELSKARSISEDTQAGLE